MEAERPVAGSAEATAPPPEAATAPLQQRMDAIAARYPPTYTYTAAEQVVLPEAPGMAAHEDTAAREEAGAGGAAVARGQPDAAAAYPPPAVHAVQAPAQPAPPAAEAATAPIALVAQEVPSAYPAQYPAQYPAPVYADPYAAPLAPPSVAVAEPFAAPYAAVSQGYPAPAAYAEADTAPHGDPAGELPPAAPPSVAAPPARPVEAPAAPSVTAVAQGTVQAPVVPPAGAYPTELTQPPAVAVAAPGGVATAVVVGDADGDDGAVVPQAEALDGSFPAQEPLTNRARAKRPSAGPLGGLQAEVNEAMAERKAERGDFDEAPDEDFVAGMSVLLWGRKTNEGDIAMTRAEEDRIRAAAEEAFNNGEALRMLGPPTWQDDGGGYFGAYDGLHCFICHNTFGLARRKHHCRNCGHLVCSKCSNKFWPKSMLPKTFKRGGGKLRVCTTCHTAFEAFRGALLEGDFTRVREVFMTGYIRDVNSPYSIYAGKLYPVHCAAVGGSVAAMRWLVEDCGAQLHALDKKRKTPLYHACANQNVDMLKYLVLERTMLLTDIKDRAVLHKALHAALLGRRPDDAPTVNAASAFYTTLAPDDDAGSNDNGKGGAEAPSAPSAPSAPGASAGAGAGAGAGASVMIAGADELPPASDVGDSNA